jgi:hypothetical protein
MKARWLHVFLASLFVAGILGITGCESDSPRSLKGDRDMNSTPSNAPMGAHGQM